MKKEERSTVEASRQAISMLLAARRQNGSSGRIAAGRKWKKKHAVGKDRRRGGHEVPRGFEPRSLDSESSMLTVTPRDQLMEVTGRVT